jgi:predicted dinucleotide-binding enzyme
MKITVIGRGNVGGGLADRWKKAGHEIQALGRDGGDASDADVVLVAVPGGEISDALGKVSGLDGKVVIDATNPIADTPPTSGVLAFFTSLEESLLERLQAEFPGIRFVKAFNSVGSAHMVDPKFAGGRPTMFICGNDAPAKGTVAEILDRFGWDCEDMGSVQAARAIEPLCMLWCIPGFLRGQWSHAFKLLK